jgi:hypothetical protein
MTSLYLVSFHFCDLITDACTCYAMLKALIFYLQISYSILRCSYRPHTLYPFCSFPFIDILCLFSDPL